LGQRPNIAPGAWLVLSPFALGYADRAARVWIDVITGAAIAGLAVWSAVSTGQIASSAETPDGGDPRRRPVPGTRSGTLSS